MATEVGNIFIGLHVDVGQMGRFASAATDVERHSRRMNTALGATTGSVRSLRSQMAQGARFRIAADSLRDLTKATDEVGRLRAAILGLSALSGAGITGSFTAAYLVQTADRAKLLGNQIRTVTTDFANYGATQDKLFDIAQRTRTSLETTTNLYARTSRAVEKFGMSQQKVLTITETVQKAFAIGGATPQEAAGAALQLSQGIASDRFGGEEFRSVAENAPVLLGAIAKALNTSIGGLRKMSMEGKLTAQTVTEAILKSTDEINAKYAMMTPTVAQAFTVLDNSFLRYIGETDKAYGATDALAGALMGIADNFENIAYWVTKATALVAAFYVANKAQQAGRNYVSGIRETNASIREQIANEVDRRSAIESQRAKVSTAIGDAGRMVTDAEDAALLRQQDQVSKAREKEFTTQQQLNGLQKNRAELVGKLSLAQNASAVAAQKDIEAARERVRLDQQRVIEAQQAAIQEERILAARRAQAIAKAGGRVDIASAAVATANGRVAEAAAAIQKEKELAKVKLASEIDARRQQIVSAAMRTQSVQAQISELRALRDSGVSGFDQSFGKEYRSLLEQQQKAISSTQKLRGQIADLEKQMQGIDAGTQATRGITSAMNQHAAAVAKVQAATDSLAKAEAARAVISSGGITSRTLEQRVAAEQKALKQYESSIANLQSKMRDLRTATINGFDGAPARKLISQIDALDKKIASAKSSLSDAAIAVQSASVSDAALLRASLEAQEKAQKRINALQVEANALAESHVIATQRIVAAQQRLNVLRRAGSGVLGYFGGAAGLGITAALVAATSAVAYFAAEAQKASAKSAGLKEEMNQLGLLSDEAAGKINKTAEALENLQADKLRQKLRDVKAEIDRLKGETGFFEDLFNDDEADVRLGDISNELDAMFSRLSNPRIAQRTGVQRGLVSELKGLVEEARAGKTPIEELQRRLEEIAKQPLDSEMDGLLGKVREILPLMAALTGYVEKIGEVNFTGTMSGIDQLNKQSTSRTQAAKNQDRYAAGVDSFGVGVLREASFTEYEAKIRSIMDGLIKDAEKLGKTLLDADARRIAEQQYATEQAKTGLLNLIGTFEGTDKGRGYNETLGYGAFTGGDVNLTMMTLKEVLELQKKMLADPKNTYNSSAVGRYQITSETLRDFMGRLGLGEDTIFSPEIQDRIANEIIRSTGGSIDKLRGRWEGLKNATNEQISTASGKTFLDLPAMDESTQKWLDGMKDLDLQKQITQVDSFRQSVIQQAMAMGATNEEVKQYVAALTSGDLDAVPAKFKQIEEAMNSQVDAGFMRQLEELRQSGFESTLSDIDQQVIQVARSFGIGEEEIRSFVAAARFDNFDALPERLRLIREELQNLEGIKLNKELVSGFLNDIRSALDDGKITWEEWGDIALNVLNKIIDKLQTQFVDALFSTGSLVGNMSGGGGGGGGFFGSLFSGIGSLFGSIFGFDGGGHTGPGPKNQPAGVVHADEFVFTKKATQRAGVDTLYRLMDYLETGNMSQLMGAGMPGFADGGYVGASTLPSMPSTAMAMSNAAPAVNDNSMQAAKDQVHFTFGWDKDSNGNISPIIKQVSRESVMEAAPGIISASTSQVMPTIAKHQRNKAGGDWRNS